MSESKDKQRDARPPAGATDDKPDPAYTGMPAKEGGGKTTEAEKYADND